MIKKTKKQRIVVLSLIAIVIITSIGIYKINEMMLASKIKQYVPLNEQHFVLDTGIDGYAPPDKINNETAFGKIINNTKQSKIGSLFNLKEPTYLPSGYVVQQVRDDPLRASMNMFLSILPITDKTTGYDFIWRDGGIIIHASQLPNNFDQTEFVKIRNNYPHSTIDGKFFVFLNSTLYNYENGVRWDTPTFIEMYDEQIEIRAVGFTSPDELVKIIQSVKYDQPTTKP